MAKKITLNLLSRLLLMTMAILAVPATAVAESYSITVNIDDITRVKVQTQKMVDDNYVTEDLSDLKSGDNTLTLDETVGVIMFSPANENYNILGAHISVPSSGMEYDGRILNGVATIYVGPYLADGTITVTSAAVSMATATIKLDNVANLLAFRNNSKDNLTMKSGDNKLTFNPATDNPFLFMVTPAEDAEVYVTLNDKECSGMNSSTGFIYTVTLSDGDVLDINTGYTGGDDDGDRPDPNTLITELPLGGYPMDFTRDSYSYRMTEEGLVEGDVKSVAGEIVFYQDRYTYIKNPFTFIPNNAYLKGTNVQGVIVVKFPQKIYSSEENGKLTEYWAYRLDRVKGTDGEATGYAIDPEASQNIQFMGEGDGSWRMLITEGEDFILGACTEDGKWTGFGDTRIIFAKMDEEQATAPRGTFFNEYKFNDGGYSVYVGLNGSDIYVKGISKNLPDAIVKGTVADGKAVFPSAQYMGSYMGWHNYFYGTSYENGSPSLATELTMDFDAVNKVLKADANTGFVINMGKETLNAIESYVAPVFGNDNATGISAAVKESQNRTYTYYNLNGCRVAAPVKGGIYLRTTVTDGTVKTEKVVY